MQEQRQLCQNLTAQLQAATARASAAEVGAIIGYVRRHGFEDMYAGVGGWAVTSQLFTLDCVLTTKKWLRKLHTWVSSLPGLEPTDLSCTWAMDWLLHACCTVLRCCHVT